MKRSQILHSSCCSSTRRLALPIWMLAANNPLAHPPAIKHKTREKMLKKKHLARTDNVISMRTFKLLLSASQPVNTGCSTSRHKQQRHREKACILQKEKGCNAENRREEEAKGDNVRETSITCARYFFHFVSTVCDSSCYYYRLPASLWLLLSFIALLMTIAVSPTDLLASYIQWGAIKLIPNTV